MTQNRLELVPGAARQRGITMVSVMMLTVSLLTLGLLAMQGSTREVTQAGQLVARQRATMAAQAAVDRATNLYMAKTDEVDAALAGFNAGSGDCDVACRDCLPGTGSGFVTGRRHDVLASGDIGCAGRPCMRQGAVVQDENAVNWCDVPLQTVVGSGDAEARVSVWVRNNSADALGPGGSGLWTADGDGRVVFTASATVRNTTVTIEQEVQFAAAVATSTLLPQSADEGYGVGHNNDNSSVSVCSDDYVAVGP